MNPNFISEYVSPNSCVYRQAMCVQASAHAVENTLGLKKYSHFAACGESVTWQSYGYVHLTHISILTCITEIVREK